MRLWSAAPQRGQAGVPRGATRPHVAAAGEAGVAGGDGAGHGRAHGLRAGSRSCHIDHSSRLEAS